MAKEQEHVVLVDENNNPLGTAPKLATHNTDTPLHRGFSVFLFNRHGEILLQQRAHTKKTWPGVWSNSCCGHPAMDETVIQAANRRLKDELGLENIELHLILPDYRYRAEMKGIVENEICPVMVGHSNAVPTLNPAEVEAIHYIPWHDFLHKIKRLPGFYSPWCEEEAFLLNDNKNFQKLWNLWYNNAA